MSEKQVKSFPPCCDQKTLALWIAYLIADCPTVPQVGHADQEAAKAAKLVRQTYLHLMGKTQD